MARFSAQPLFCRGACNSSVRSTPGCLEAGQPPANVNQTTNQNDLPAERAMAPTLQITDAPESTAPSTEEMSLVDVLRARENGVDFRTAAGMFAEALEHVESKGHNLYRRMLLE